MTTVSSSMMDSQKKDFSLTEKSHGEADIAKTGPYLCTGYELYVTREPCVM